MTLKEIAIFKHFIADRDLRKPFCRIYRASHSFAKLPGNVEEYFSNVEPLAVILSGTRVCQPNSAFGYDFWQELHQDWKVFYEKNMASNFINNDDGRLEKLEGYYKILRENWDDKDKPWRFDSYADACKRLGLEPVVEEHKEEENPPVETTVEVTEEDLLADFDFLDDVLPSNYRLKSDEISINFNKGYKITFNQLDSKVIRESGLRLARLAKSKTGEICLIINSQKGANLTNISGKTGNMNATINSSDICGKLRLLFSLKNDYSILNIEKLQLSQEFIIYKITKE